MSREAPRNTGAQAPQPDTPLHSQGEPPPARTRVGEGYAPHPQQRPRADMELDTQANAPSWVVRGITRFSPDGYAHLLSTRFTDRMSSRVPASRFSTCVHYRMSIPTDGPRPPREDGPSGRRLATTGTSCTLRSLPSRCGRSLRPRRDRGTAQSAVVTMCPRPRGVDAITPAHSRVTGARRASDTRTSTWTHHRAGTWDDSGGVCAVPSTWDAAPMTGNHTFRTAPVLLTRALARRMSIVATPHHHGRPERG